MLPNKQKGQGLVEFALILPFLLLALLGIIEAARIIWAYTTVQTAARETARYAITGKPYITSNFTYCDKPEGEPGASAPWNCNDDTWFDERVKALRAVARERLGTLPLKTECTVSADIAANGPCTQEPGNYGVMIIGQRISPTLSITTPVEQFDYPGSQGLNIKVRIFYNVEMLDPIFDAISDGLLGRSNSYIQVSGEVTMQNEGIEPALGNAPPPAIGSGSVITGTPSTGAGPNGELIWSLSGYTIRQNQELVVHLENHQSQGGPYDIYLGTTKICSAVNTSTQHNGDYSCLIDANFPPGLYDLFSTKESQYPNRLATAPQQVRVELNTVASIVISDPGTGQPRDFWANNSYLQIQLVAHDSAQQPFNIYFNYGLPSQQTVALGVNANVTLPPWKVSVAGNPCPVGGTPCTIQSRRASDNSFVASADLFISQPEIVIAGGGTEFAQGETLFIFLKGHTPNTKYDLQITDSGGNSYYLGRTAQPTNDLGDTVSPLIWTVFESGVPGWPAGWPDGFSTITSHPVADPPSMTSANRVAEKQINIKTPSGPFITVDGGYTWPINSIITIRIHKHPPTAQPPDYYLRFGSFSVPVNGANAPNYPFNVGSSQSAAQNYLIPIEAATGPTTTHTIRSFRRFDDQLMAQRDVTVTSMPVITVLEGDRALPDATITISLIHHVPNSVYQIVYAGVPLLEASGQPFTIQTDSSGKGQRTYSLLTLSASSPAANPSNYGTAFNLNSQQTIAPNALVATTTLTIDSADLKITQIQLPANAAINASIPMTVTIQNTKPVTIARYFDIDLYVDPSPLVPAYKPNQFNFPGDVKLWKPPIVAPYGQPGDTFSLTQPFSITTYGKHTFYGYADTSNFIFNENNEVNNVLSNTITIGCNYPFITDSFSNLSAWAPAKIYNSADTQNQAGYPRISGERLQMSNDGKSTSGVNDNASSKGHVLLYRTQPVATEPGLDVRVQVLGAPNTANFAKAGLQVRADPANAQSAKIEFNLAWDSSNNRHRIQMNYRTTGLATGGQNTNGFLNVTTGNPVWLRIKREPNSDTFTFYYAQQAAVPTDAQWTVYATQTIAISPTVYVGLFNASYVNNTNGRAEFDNFILSDTSVCPAAQGTTPPPVPPGLTLCTDPLQNKSFETLSAWVLAGSEGVVTGPGGHTGNRQLLAHTFNGQYRKPYFYQQFQMPASLLATTTLKLNFFYTLNNLGDGDEVNDKYYAVVATGPSLVATQISNPVEIANGDVPPEGASAPPNTATGWIEKNLTLPVASGINLADYAGQNLYLYIYNNSNTIGVGCDPPGCHASEFFFDDINLGICTGEPEPTSASTKLTGDVVLHQLGAPPQKIAGVTVWAYAENGALNKTFTIQNGKFNFYNLPATPTGIKYFIYAEYHIVDPNDPNQIDTLAANTTVTLKTTHTLQTPLETRLDLFPTN